jgi:hypothetical protein
LIVGQAVMAITKAWQRFSNAREVRDILKKRAFLVIMMRIRFMSRIKRLGPTFKRRLHNQQR